MAETVKAKGPGMTHGKRHVRKDKRSVAILLAISLNPGVALSLWKIQQLVVEMIKDKPTYSLIQRTMKTAEDVGYEFEQLYQIDKESPAGKKNIPLAHFKLRPWQDLESKSENEERASSPES